MELKSGTASMIGLAFIPLFHIHISRIWIFCLACMLFPVNPKNGQRAASLLFSEPYQNWKDARIDLLIKACPIGIPQNVRNKAKGFH